MLKLAANWPSFLKNSAFLTILTKKIPNNVNVEEQYTILKILTARKILNEELIDMHFEQFMKLSDRDQVKKYVANYLKAMAYLGHTGRVHMLQLTQVFRRLYKRP